MFIGPFTVQPREIILKSEQKICIVQLKRDILQRKFENMCCYEREILLLIYPEGWVKVIKTAIKDIHTPKRKKGRHLTI